MISYEITTFSVNINSVYVELWFWKNKNEASRLPATYAQKFQILDAEHSPKDKYGHRSVRKSPHLQQQSPTFMHGSVVTMVFTFLFLKSSQGNKDIFEKLTLMVLKWDYSGVIRSIRWLVMSWLLASPGHQQSYCLYMQNKWILVIYKENFNCLPHLKCCCYDNLQCHQSGWSWCHCNSWFSMTGFNYSQWYSFG